MLCKVLLVVFFVLIIFVLELDCGRRSYTIWHRCGLFHPIVFGTGRCARKHI
jgi:hypothetical protein